MAGSDDLLSPDEIEALMQAARSGSAPTPSSPAPAKPAHSELLDPSDIEALMRQSSPTAAAADREALSAADIDALMQGSSRGSGSDPERLLQQAQGHLAQAMGSDRPRSKPKGPPPALGAPKPYSFDDLGGRSSLSQQVAFPIAALEDVELDLRIELGRTELLIEDVLQLREGTVVPLDKLAGDPVDILVNGRLIARGEVLVLNDNFCVRVAEILTPSL